MNIDPLQQAHALRQAGRLTEAAKLYGDVLIQNPGHFAASQALTDLLIQSGRFEKALAVLDTVLPFHPENVDIHSRRGVLLLDLRRFEEAVTSFSRALALDPGNARLRLNRAHALSNLARYADAAREYETVLAAEPALAFVRGNLIRNKLRACDWTGLDSEWSLAMSEMRAGKPSLAPIAALALEDRPEYQLSTALILTAARFPAQAPLWRGERYAHDRIRVAYLSADFHAHATATLMAGVFELHDRNAFETIAVSFGRNDGSAMRKRLEQAFDRFLHVPEKSPPDIAQLVREMEVDIAIDLKGHTDNARPGIFALRPAPVAVNYLGHPATMGAAYIDYLIADRVVIPESDARFYDEKIVYLPHSYQPNDARAMAERTPSRGEAGLPPTGFVFCCFNNTFKITPAVFALWMEIMRASPSSVLWLRDDNQDATRNLRRAAESKGIAAERLVFAPPLPPDKHLARHALADLFLDTLPYNAHTTGSDALWSGLPLITCIGTTFAGRVAASLLQACDLPELITHSPGDYRALAIKLAQDAEALAALKAKVKRARTYAPLFDTAATTRHLESAYRAMHERSARGLGPESFAVEDG